MAWSRRRRWLTAAAAAAVGAAATYYGYNRWWTSYRRPRREAPLVVEMSQLEVETGDNLLAHFNSIQAIADGTTLPQLMAELRARIGRAADVDHLLQQLQGAKERGMSAAEKARLWDHMAQLAFVRTLSAVWLVPLLHLLVRTQLNILGRRLFLQANLGPARPWPLGVGSGGGVSKRAQELFLEMAHHFPERGAPYLVTRMAQVAGVVLGKVDLKRRVTAEDLSALMNDISAGFAAELLHMGAPVMALPSGPDVAHYFALWHVPGADPQAAAAQQADERVVESMLEEARAAMASPRFKLALEAAVAEARHVIDEQLSAGVGPDPLPLARAVPRVAAAGDALLRDSPAAVECIAAISAVPHVSALCAAIYSCGPPL